MGSAWRCFGTTASCRCGTWAGCRRSFGPSGWAGEGGTFPGTVPPGYSHDLPASFAARPSRPPARIDQVLHGLLLDDELSVKKPIGRLPDLDALLIPARISMRRRFDDDREGAAVEVERGVEVEHALWRVSRIRLHGRIA